jgi:hypothetical protein
MNVYTNNVRFFVNGLGSWIPVGSSLYVPNNVVNVTIKFVEGTETDPKTVELENPEIQTPRGYDSWTAFLNDPGSVTFDKVLVEDEIGGIAVGVQGATGERGPQGFQGGAGAVGLKTAMVRSGEGWAEMYAMEAPEVLFVDVVRLLVGVSQSPLDQKFVEVCEHDSFHVIGLAGAEVQNGAIVLDAPLQKSVSVMVTGVRKGAAGIRMAEVPAELAEKNNAFWDGLREV